jgi:hypothetical protein
MEDKITTHIDYVGVELIKKGSTDAADVEVGLLCGLRERVISSVNTLFILLGYGNTTEEVTAFNFTMYYNVLSINITRGGPREIVIYKANKEDQCEAAALLGSIVKSFTAEGRMLENDPEIIDIETYKNVPAEVYNSPRVKPVAGEQRNAAAQTNKGASSVPGYNYNCGWSDPTWKRQQKLNAEERARQDKMRQTPTIFERTDPLPSTDFLSQMKRKIEMIMNGDALVDVKCTENSVHDNDEVVCKTCLHKVGALGKSPCSKCEKNNLYTKWTA